MCSPGDMVVDLESSNGTLIFGRNEISASTASVAATVPAASVDLVRQTWQKPLNFTTMLRIFVVFATVSLTRPLKTCPGSSSLHGPTYSR